MVLRKLKWNSVKPNLKFLSINDYRFLRYDDYDGSQMPGSLLGGGPILMETRAAVHGKSLKTEHLISVLIVVENWSCQTLDSAVPQVFKVCTRHFFILFIHIENLQRITELI